MAYETGTATSQEDLISKLFTFAVANGWTQDNLDTANNKGSLHRDNIYVHFAWDGAESGGPDNIAIYQSLGFIAAGTDVWAHTDDSGNGEDSNVLDSQRRVDSIGNGPFTAHHFFADDTIEPYIHVVLEYSPGLYRHFGFGMIDKIGDWTGGEYAYGHVWTDGVIFSPESTSHSLLLDGLHSNSSAFNELVPATLHIEGMPNQAGASKWGNVGAGVNTGWQGLDRAGNPRITVRGSTRGSVQLNAFSRLVASALNGAVPLIPIPVWYDDWTTSPDSWYLLGYMIDVRHVQMEAFDPGQEITVGSDVWKIFPAVRKSDTGSQEESENMGIAYKKIP